MHLVPGGLGAVRQVASLTVTFGPTVKGLQALPAAKNKC